MAEIQTEEVVQEKFLVGQMSFFLLANYTELKLRIGDSNQVAELMALMDFGAQMQLKKDGMSEEQITNLMKKVRTSIAERAGLRREAYAEFVK